MSRAVLDASAILAFLRGEPGAGVVAGYRGDSLVSAVNVAEAGGRLSDFGMRGADVRRSIDLMALEIVPFDAEQAHAAAGIRAVTRRRGLPALTADRAWMELGVAVDVRLVRD